MDSLLTVKLWAAAAWADGELHPREAAALRRLIDHTDDLDAEARAQAIGYLDSQPEVSVTAVNQLDAPAREGILRAARRIIALDGKLTDDELAFLDRLRASLDLPEETKQKIESEGS